MQEQQPEGFLGFWSFGFMVEGLGFGCRAWG